MKRCREFSRYLLHLGARTTTGVELVGRRSGANVAHVLRQAGRQLFVRRCLVARLAMNCFKPFGLSKSDFRIQLQLGLEVVKQQPVGHSGFIGDVVDGHQVKVLTAEKSFASVKQLLARDFALLRRSNLGASRHFPHPIRWELRAP